MSLGLSDDELNEYVSNRCLLSKFTTVVYEAKDDVLHDNIKLTPKERYFYNLVMEDLWEVSEVLNINVDPQQAENIDRDYNLEWSRFGSRRTATITKNASEFVWIVEITENHSNDLLYSHLHTNSKLADLQQAFHSTKHLLYPVDTNNSKPLCKPACCIS